MSQEDRNLVVLSYNIHSCVGSDGAYSVDRIAHVLTQINADVVCMQEVEVNAARQTTRTWSVEHHDDQPTLIAQKAGYPHVRFARAISCKADGGRETITDEGDGDFGICILSKWPMEEHKILRFSPYSTKTLRNALACRILTPNAGSVWVACTHLGRDFLGGEQLQQAIELRGFIEELQSTGLPVVLTGDFNSPSWFSAVKEVKKVLSDTSIGRKGTFLSTGLFRGTFPAIGLFRGIITLDYILYDSSNMSCTSAMVHFDGAVASDHLPLSSCLQIKWKDDSTNGSSAKADS